MMDALVVGGGAAGMMCAVFLLRGGKKVTILEKNEKLGKKLFITGKGRCNLSNMSDVEEHLNAIRTNRKFMFSALYG
ncbi:MAG: FAD-dependent oxidoreductase, partial [Lachnospiraceae bacterium]|nr:FAD-dependent oxidoreductase [Lachnospiraceae bacterium]